MYRVVVRGILLGMVMLVWWNLAGNVVVELTVEKEPVIAIYSGQRG